MIMMLINIRKVSNDVRLSATYPKHKRLTRRPMAAVPFPNIQVRPIISRIERASLKDPTRPLLPVIHQQIPTNSLPLPNGLSPQNA